MFKKFLTSILIIIFLNVLFQCLAIFSGTERSPINVDYFLLLVLLNFNYKKLYYLLGFCISFFDFMNIFVQIFPFVRIEDLFSILKFTFISSLVYQLTGLSILFLVILQYFLVGKIYSPKLNTSFLAIFNIFILVIFFQKYILGVGGTGKFWKPQTGEWVVSGVINYLASTKSLFTDSFKDTDQALKKLDLEQASKELFGKIEQEKILFIINESWGIPLDPKIQKAVIQPLTKLQGTKITDIALGKIKFSGFTVAAELRELCQVVPLNYNLKNQKDGFEECLPHQLKKQGYKTVGVHGALGSMYDRQYWYPRAGFEESIFRDKNLNLKNSRCYSFPGNCDKDIAPFIAHKLKNNNKVFVYWLTLNTHATYDNRDLYYDKFDCLLYGVTENTHACRNLKLQYQFFYTLSNLLIDIKQSGVKVIVVGDHAPPILTNEKKVFQDNVVPKIEFLTK